MDEARAGGQAGGPGRRSSALSPVLLVGLAVVLLGGGILGYFAWQKGQTHPTPIGEILADLRTYDGQTVTVNGTVENPTNIVLAKMYELRDDSGTIRVFTERGLPAAGSEITVSGIVKQAYQIGELQMTVILEPQGVPEP